MTFHVAQLDSAFSIGASAPLLDALRTSFGVAGTSSGAVHHDVRVDGLTVLLDGEPVHVAADETRLLETVLMVINAAVIADVRSFTVHAGVVARDDVAVAWPGLSGAGKSTLTAACLRMGFDYVSDEALALEDGRARPYLKPLSLSAWSLNAVGLPGLRPGTAERAVPYRELGAAAAPGPVPLGHLVVLKRTTGPARLKPASSATTAMLLLEHSFNHYKQPAEAFAAASTAAANASCWTLSYEAPSEGAAALRRLFA